MKLDRTKFDGSVRLTDMKDNKNKVIYLSEILVLVIIVEYNDGSSQSGEH
jgi:hypothetical protein